MSDPWTCHTCGARFPVPTLATTPNADHRTGCPLRTGESK